MRSGAYPNSYDEMGKGVRFPGRKAVVAQSRSITATLCGG